MSRRKTARLAYCEYVSRETDSIAVAQARLQLIEAAKRVYPKLLKKLSTEVFPFYCELADAGFHFDQILWSAKLSPYGLLPTDSHLKSALSQWASQFNAGADWLLDEVLRAFRGWYVAPDWRESLKWNSQYGHSTVAMGVPFEFQCEGWEMQLLTWPRYSAFVRERFERTLSNYEATARKHAESHGLVRAPRKYSLENFDWFVLYQFAGLSSVEIANRSKRINSVDESTVLKGVKTAAKLIAWGQLRPQTSTQTRKIR